LGMRTRIVTYDYIVDMLFKGDEILSIEVLRTILLEYIDNSSVRLLMQKFDFGKLFSYGVHKILEDRKLLHPVDVFVDTNRMMHWNGLRVTVEDLVVTECLSPHGAHIYSSGISCGHMNLTMRGQLVGNTSNVYVVTKRAYSKIPLHFDYAYCIETKNLLMSTDVYNRLIIEESKEAIEMLRYLSRVECARRRLYKIPILNYTSPTSELVLIDGSSLLGHGRSDFSSVLKMQEQLFV
jgi:hypothetical protein